MPDLTIDFCGIKNPNPFWLASGPPTNSGEQIRRAFDTGWGGAVWKTLGNPAVNVNSRYAAMSHGRNKILGLNNIELITDRGLSVNLKEMTEVKKSYPELRNGSTNGGYCGPAVKPIALYMAATLCRDQQFNLPVSGIGGINSWQDAAEFIVLGCTSVQVCTAVMHHGFGIVTEMIDGLSAYMVEHIMENLSEMRGKAIGNYKEWGELDMNYKVVASVSEQDCIGCLKCYTACRDGAYQAIDLSGKMTKSGKEIPVIIEDRCTGCNLCSLVCPVDCISMLDVSATAKVESWQDIIAKGKHVITDGLTARFPE